MSPPRSIGGSSGYRRFMNRNPANLFFRPCAILGMAGVFVFLIFSAPSPAVSKDRPSKPRVSKPSKFKVSYKLKKNSSKSKFGAKGLFSSAGSVASIAVNILDERFHPVKAFVIRKVKKANRIETLWDGRDIYGKEAPAGKYYASLSILYSDGSKETKFFKFVKE